MRTPVTVTSASTGATDLFSRSSSTPEATTNKSTNNLFRKVRQKFITTSDNSSTSPTHTTRNYQNYYRREFVRSTSSQNSTDSNSFDVFRSSQHNNHLEDLDVRQLTKEKNQSLKPNHHANTVLSHWT
jgi:hypothetical protein